MLVVLLSSMLSFGASAETLTLVVSHPATMIGAAPETASSSIDSLSAPVPGVSTLLGSCSQDCDAGDLEDAIDDLWLACVFVLLAMLALIGNLLWDLREQAKLEALCYQPLERPG
jgi:hypothetical protein